MVDLQNPPPPIEGVVIESLQDRRASKLTCILSRSDPRDRVDLLFLERAGFRPELDLALALQKDAGIDVGALAWLLNDFPVAPLRMMLVPCRLSQVSSRSIGLNCALASKRSPRSPRWLEHARFVPEADDPNAVLFIEPLARRRDPIGRAQLRDVAALRFKSVAWQREHAQQCWVDAGACRGQTLSNPSSSQTSSYEPSVKKRHPGGSPKNFRTSGLHSTRCSTCSGTKKSGSELGSPSPAHRYHPVVPAEGKCLNPLIGTAADFKFNATPTFKSGGDANHAAPYLAHVSFCFLSMSFTEQAPHKSRIPAKLATLTGRACWALRLH